VLIRAKEPGANSAILQSYQPDRRNYSSGCAVVQLNLAATTIYSTDFAGKIHESMDRLRLVNRSKAPFHPAAAEATAAATAGIGGPFVSGLSL
jgi:hypothetical protein